MTDLELTEAYLTNSNPSDLPDSIRRNLAESVLARRGYTYEQLDSTFKWYGKNLDDYYELQDKVEKEIAYRTRKYGGGDVAEDLGERNIWRLNDHAFFSSMSPVDGLNFSISYPDIEKGGNIEWSMRLNNSSDVKVVLGADYDDGTYTFNTSSNYGQRAIKCQLTLDSVRKVTRLFGNIKVSPEKTPLWADSIRLIKNPFDSLTYYKINSQRTYRY